MRLSMKMGQGNSFALLLIGLAVCSHVSLGADRKTNLDDTIKAIDECMMRAVFSFLGSEFYPPTSMEQLKSSCRIHGDNFKCIKDGLKNAEPLVKRGMNAFAQTRQRYNKKICTNPNSDVSKTWIRDMKCLVDKRLDSYKEADAVFTNSLLELRRKNMNDPALELKHLCCIFVRYKANYIKSVGKDCADSKANVEDLMVSNFSDTRLICDDDEKLNKEVCPSIPPYKNISRTYTFKKGGLNGPTGTLLYIISTLGEPDPSLPVNT